MRQGVDTPPVTRRPGHLFPLSPRLQWTAQRRLHLYRPVDPGLLNKPRCPAASEVAVRRAVGGRGHHLMPTDGHVLEQALAVALDARALRHVVEVHVDRAAGAFLRLAALGTLHPFKRALGP